METISTDVLVIGAGAAGIRAALAACEAGVDVILTAQGELCRAGSTFSPISKGWGIQALVGEERTDENLEAFYDDIIRVGLGQCDPKLVRILVEESGPRIEDLIEWGIRFRRDSIGRYIRAKGCFSDYERAFITEDFGNLQRCFQSIFRRLPVKTVKCYVTDLIIADSVCWGARAVLESGEILRINAKATVLATGGGAGIFRDHLVSEDQIGDGYAIAHRAGAELRNMEFIQFMLGLKSNRTPMFLPVGDLRKPGMMFDSKSRDLLETDIPEPELRASAIDERQKHLPFSCRDSSCLVDLAVARAAEEGREVSWREGEPGNKWSIVAHFSHAFNGGVKVNERAESTVPGLYAAGEVAAGPHGADRIGGCMMTATQVFGRKAGQWAAGRVKRLRGCAFPCSGTGGDMESLGYMLQDALAKPIVEIKRRVRDTMGKYAMVLRSKKGLGKCLVALCDLEIRLEEIKLKGTISPIDYFETRNMIFTGKLVAKSALERKESLGSHFRGDFIKN